MAEAIDRERRELATQLWIEDGLTYDAVAARTGISVGALKKWAAEEGWSERRSELRQALRDIRIGKIRYLGDLIKNANKTMHAQDAFAVAAVSGVVDKVISQNTGSGAPIAPENMLEIKTPQQAIAALEGEIEQRVWGMLSGGSIDLKSIKELKASLDMLGRMKGEANKVELFMEFMKVLIEYLGKHDQEALGALEGNFDEFMAYIRDRYKVA